MQHKLPLAVLALTACALPVSAGSFSFEGIFTNDTDVQLFTFNLLADTPGVSFRTWSYAGGTNAAGTPIAAGGFNTHLSMFTSTGSAMNPGLTGCGGGILTADSSTGVCGDSYYLTTTSFPGGLWTAGTYILALSLDANNAIGDLADGFFANAVLGLSSPDNFTCRLAPDGFQNGPTFPTSGAFCDSATSVDTQRDGHWSVDLLNVDSAILGTESATATAPEPATFAVGLLGIAALIARRRVSAR